MRTLFDGEIHREWPDEGLMLGDLNEQARRQAVQYYMKILVPSSVGDPKFEYITQGRSLVEKKGQRYFSTCGELVMTSLYLIGYRGPCLNRNLSADDGGPRKFIPGRNMSMLMGHLGGPSASEHAWVKWEGEDGPLPKLGDIVCVTEGPPRTEHVMVMIKPENIDSDDSIDALYVAEAGRGGTFDQHCGFGLKEMFEKKLNGKTCVGFIDIGKLELTQPAKPLVQFDNE